MRVLSGIQPTGVPHWGNYFGAIRQHIDLQNNEQAFYFIADLHALTTIHDPKVLQDYTREMALTYLALGLDPKRATLFRQSDVPEVAELTWLLMTVTPMHLLEKCHAYKDKKAKGLPADAGLFNYPVLMAADILLYDSDLVPVGADQVQHIEVTRDIAQRINGIYGEVLTLPNAHVVEATAKVPGTDGEKMSKSYGNTIEIFEEPKKLRKKIMSIKTDSTPVEAPKDPDRCSLFALYTLFATPEQQAALADSLSRRRNGIRRGKTGALRGGPRLFCGSPGPSRATDRGPRNGRIDPQIRRRKGPCQGAGSPRPRPPRLRVRENAHVTCSSLKPTQSLDGLAHSVRKNPDTLFPATWYNLLNRIAAKQFRRSPQEQIMNAVRRHVSHAFRTLLCFAVITSATATCLRAGETEASRTPPIIGRQLPDFLLPDTAGKQVALHDLTAKAGDKGLVIVYFMGIDCPISNLYLKDLADLAKRHEKQGVRIVGIQANAGITPASAAEHARQYKVAFPVLIDAGQRVARQFAATRTAEVFVLDRLRSVRYHGEIDDRYGYTYKRGEPTRRELEQAVQELLAGKPVSVAETTPRGCLITHDDRPTASSNVTYARDISRIFQHRCQECHRAGEVAPFALEGYDDAVEHSAMIKEVVIQRRMPPWHADPRYGKFTNDRRLTQDEIDKIVEWTDAGTPWATSTNSPAAEIRRRLADRPARSRLPAPQARESARDGNRPLHVLHRPHETERGCLGSGGRGATGQSLGRAPHHRLLPHSRRKLGRRPRGSPPLRHRPGRSAARAAAGCRPPAAGRFRARLPDALHAQWQGGNRPIESRPDPLQRPQRR